MFQKHLGILSFIQRLKPTVFLYVKGFILLLHTIVTLAGNLSARPYDFVAKSQYVLVLTLSLHVSLYIVRRRYSFPVERSEEETHEEL